MNSRRSSRWGVPAIGAAAIVVLAFVLYSAVLKCVGNLLVEEDSLSPAAVVIVPEWVSTAGSLEAADIVRAGYARRVGVLKIPTNHAISEVERRLPNWTARSPMARLIVALGVNDVDEIAEPIDGSEEEVQFLRRWIQQGHPAAVIVISSRDHSHRLHRMLERELKGVNVKVMVRAARFDDFDPDAWWRTRAGVRAVSVELPKLVLEIVRHPWAG